MPATRARVGEATLDLDRFEAAASVHVAQVHPCTWYGMAPSRFDAAATFSTGKYRTSASGSTNGRMSPGARSVSGATTRSSPFEQGGVDDVDCAGREASAEIVHCSQRLEFVIKECLNQVRRRFHFRVELCLSLVFGPRPSSRHLSTQPPKLVAVCTIEQMHAFARDGYTVFRNVTRHRLQSSLARMQALLQEQPVAAGHAGHSYWLAERIVRFARDC